VNVFDRFDEADRRMTAGRADAGRRVRNDRLPEYHPAKPRQ
jgi:hypothetical protein